MIPKVIHYCWFGGNEKPDIIKKCIQSWREKCPDYEIKEWNESNFDVTINRYMYEAYQKKVGICTGLRTRVDNLSLWWYIHGYRC